ncbi:putative signal transducing protein [Catenovulum maritimum]|uniref:RanBP2-type domain-containing protein n=1 Tax=Catenovulum maritimum TaxID=1513271 RepID=A0A0J8GT10_9ALTE|nr:DUF2007 domain-containing protein [Catenovulum maritimum]KMT65930.1 hypothetical protein XM47_05570 [Catenovulum maritimum]
MQELDEWPCVYTDYNSITIHCIKGLLTQQGIETKLIGEALSGASGEIPITETEIKLLVFHTKFTQAKDLVHKFETNAESSWFCRQCDEENSGTFEICWQCGHDPATE